MNRRELQSDQPIHVPLLRVLNFPPSDVHCRLSRAARATPSNHTQRYASCNCSELRCYSNTLRRFRTEYEAVQVATLSADRQYIYGTAYSGARIVWGDAAVAVRAGVAELATFSFVCRNSSDMTCSDYASVIALCCQVS